MESRNGKASEMPRPRTTVRRGSDFPVMAVLSLRPILTYLGCLRTGSVSETPAARTNGAGAFQAPAHTPSPPTSCSVDSFTVRLHAFDEHGLGVLAATTEDE